MASVLARLCNVVVAAAILNLNSTVADDVAPLTTLSDRKIEYRQIDKPYVVLRRGDIEAIVANNQAIDDAVLRRHKAGLNGIASLKHSKRTTSVFVPNGAGLNFEHIHDGTPQDRKVHFEPRHAPMELRLIDDNTVELYQRPTSHYGLESCHRYRLLKDGTIEMTFECIAHRKSFANRYIGLFWASYIHQPESPDIHFKGHRDGESPKSEWIRGVSPAHGKLSTHISATDQRLFEYDKEFPLTLVFNRSKYRYAEPWYYGVSHGMALIFAFRPQDQVRFSQSPSGGGPNNPAWDFQFFIADYELNRLYQMIMHLIYVPFESREQIENLAEQHEVALSGSRTSDVR